MYGINNYYQLIVYMLVLVVCMFKNRMDKYLAKTGYTYNRGTLHLEYYEYTLDQVIASEVFIGWQSC